MKHKISIALKGCVAYKFGSEDSFFAQGDTFVVTDGVTRSYEHKYPDPSPALLVAQLVAQTVGINMLTGANIKSAFKKANFSAKNLNHSLGFSKTDYLFSDLAGCTASAVRISDQFFEYGFIGDCGVAIFNSESELTWRTPDEVVPAVRTFKTLIAETATNDRLVRIRRDFRNQPNADHPTYGVITGEKKALAYVRTGKMTYQKGDTILLHSDGAASFFDDISFRQLIVAGKKKNIVDYLKANSSPTKNNDDKTLLILKI